MSESTSLDAPALFAAAVEAAKEEAERAVTRYTRRNVLEPDPRANELALKDAVGMALVAALTPILEECETRQFNSELPPDVRQTWREAGCLIRALVVEAREGPTG